MRERWIQILIVVLLIPYWMHGVLIILDGLGLTQFP